MNGPDESKPASKYGTRDPGTPVSQERIEAFQARVFIEDYRMPAKAPMVYGRAVAITVSQA
jgi:hypothetical protein